MGLWTTLKASVTNILTTNGNNEIMGINHHDLLQDVINQVGDYENRGTVTTSSLAPTIERSIVWPTQVGTYTNFNSLVVATGEVCFFKNVNGITWTKSLLSTIPDTADFVDIADQHRIYHVEATGDYNPVLPFDDVVSVPTAPLTGINSLIVLYDDGIGVFEITVGWTIDFFKAYGSGGGVGDMTKAVYDTGDNGIVDEAEAVTGVVAATNSQYYGKDGLGAIGFHDIPDGAGDMLKTIYDVNDVGIVDSSQSLKFFARVDELAGVAMGEVVYINGATGNQMEASLAVNNDTAKMESIAIATETGADNDTIVFQHFGELGGLDTSSYLEGDILYLDSTEGQLTNVHPDLLEAVMRVATVVRSHATEGVLFINIVQLTVVDDYDGFVRLQLVNLSAGTSAIVNTTYINDAENYISINMQGSNNSFGANEGSI